MLAREKARIVAVGDVVNHHIVELQPLGLVNGAHEDALGHAGAAAKVALLVGVDVGQVVLQLLGERALPAFHHVLRQICHEVLEFFHRVNELVLLQPVVGVGQLGDQRRRLVFGKSTVKHVAAVVIERQIGGTELHGQTPVGVEDFALKWQEVLGLFITMAHQAHGGHDVVVGHV